MVYVQLQARVTKAFVIIREALVLMLVPGREYSISYQQVFSCATWVPNGFCSSTFYTAAQKKQYCAKSCKLC